MANYFPSVVLLPVRDVEAIMLPLISICEYSHSLFGSILSVNRKLLLQRELSRKTLGIVLLIDLLAAVSEERQRETVQALMHSFSLPLVCRRALYQVRNI